jgi:hypothetical protein
MAYSNIFWLNWPCNIRYKLPGTNTLLISESAKPAGTYEAGCLVCSQLCKKTQLNTIKRISFTSVTRIGVLNNSNRCTKIPNPFSTIRLALESL